MNAPTNIQQRTPLSRRRTNSLLLTFVAALFAAIALLLVAVGRTDAQAQGEVWGDNRDGQLGDGTTTNSTTPVQVSNLSGVQTIAVGALHSLALKDDGTVWAWGYNYNGQLGNGTTTHRAAPSQVIHLSGVQAIAARREHSLALTDTTAPKVTSTVPTLNATRVAPTIYVRAFFSKDMQAASVKSAFKLFKKGSTTNIAEEVSYDPATDKATLEPNNDLRSGVTYKAVVTTGAKDMAGNRLDQDPTLDGPQQMKWFFTVKR